MKESSFVTDAIRRSSDKTRTLYQTHIGSFNQLKKDRLIISKRGRGSSIRECPSGG